MSLTSKPGKVSWAILDFFKDRVLGKDLDFSADDLRAFVRAKIGDTFAPGSPDRIMRQLRLAGRVNYALVSRSCSLYKVVPTQS